MSKLYLARPVDLSGPSTRWTFVPIKRRCFGQAVAMLRPLSLRLAQRRDGVAHLLVGAAAADVAAQGLLDLGRRGLGVLVESGSHGDDEARRAEAALLGVVLHERGGHGVELRPAEAGGRLDLLAAGLERQHAAGVHRLAVEHHGAGAASTA